ncbi:hypothetical protein H671_6g15871 [Cricetulus griseus]|nr:hypothetical protein H671_6g15871 [Cricetulus griseus]
MPPSSVAFSQYTEPQAHPPSAPQYPKGASEHYPGLRNPSCSFYPGLRNPSCSFLPDLWDQPSHSEDSFKKKPTAGLPRGEFITARKANALSREGLRTRRRNCPFRVRFEDETLQDTALRYWERSRACVGGRQDNEEDKRAAQEPQIYFSEDANMSSRLPFIHRATAIRPRGGLRTFLDTPNSVEQEPFLPSMMMQSVLNRGRPKGYRLLLPYTNQQQAQSARGFSVDHLIEGLYRHLLAREETARTRRRAWSIREDKDAIAGFVLDWAGHLGDQMRCHPDLQQSQNGHRNGTGTCHDSDLHGSFRHELLEDTKDNP